MKLSKIMIFAPELVVARQFYHDVLGFELRSESSNRLSLEHTGCEFIVYKCENVTAIGDYANEARAVFVFEVANLDAMLEHLRSHHVTILHSTPGENPDGRYAAFVDPFGIVHELFQPRSKAGQPPDNSTLD